MWNSFVPIADVETDFQDRIKLSLLIPKIIFPFLSLFNKPIGVDHVDKSDEHCPKERMTWHCAYDETYLPLPDLKMLVFGFLKQILISIKRTLILPGAKCFKKQIWYLWPYFYLVEPNYSNLVKEKKL